MQAVLVVDDEAMIREAVASYLEKQGYQVFAVDNGREALVIFEQKNRQPKHRRKIYFVVFQSGQMII